jgi:dihydroorotate dehydrogenase
MQPEASHDLALATLKKTPNALLRQCCDDTIEDRPCSLMGLDFPNPIGLAAGLDKNADYFESLAALGFGFIEVGTVTPRPQPGNDKPRMFRLKNELALINRMGFNNKGVDHLVEQISQRSYRGILGVNIGKNLTTPLESAHEDYLYCMRRVYAHADYITVNISSPNTPGLRDLQLGESLEQLLQVLKEEQRELSQQHGRYVPVAVKVAPDMASEDVVMFADTAKRFEIDAIIAGNTTASRDGVENSAHGSEAGGLSGAPLTTRARRVIAQLAQRLHGEVPIIGCGGILDSSDAVAHRQAGADLLQVYTGLIYRGPQLINDIRRTLSTTNLGKSDNNG